MIRKLLKKTGSVALISVLILSSVCIILVLSMSDTNISTSYQYLNNSSEKLSYYVAEACLEETIIRLENDTSFSEETLTIDSDTSCDISVSGSGILTVGIDVNYKNYSQSFEAEVSITAAGHANNVSLLKWEEI